MIEIQYKITLIFLKTLGAHAPPHASLRPPLNILNSYSHLSKKKKPKTLTSRGPASRDAFVNKIIKLFIFDTF